MRKLNSGELLYTPNSLRFFIVEYVQCKPTGEVDYASLLEFGNRQRILIDGEDLLDKIDAGAFKYWAPTQIIDKRVKPTIDETTPDISGGAIDNRTPEETEGIFPNQEQMDLG